MITSLLGSASSGATAVGILRSPRQGAWNTNEADVAEERGQAEDILAGDRGESPRERSSAAVGVVRVPLHNHGHNHGHGRGDRRTVIRGMDCRGSGIWLESEVCGPHDRVDEASPGGHRGCCPHIVVWLQVC